MTVKDFDFYYTDEEIKEINEINYNLSIAPEFKEVYTGDNPQSKKQAGVIFEQFINLESERIKDMAEDEILNDAKRKTLVYLELLPVHKNEFLFAQNFIMGVDTVENVKNNLFIQWEAAAAKPNILNADHVAKHLIYYEFIPHIMKYYKLEPDKPHALDFPEFEFMIIYALKFCPYVTGKVNFFVSDDIDYKIRFFRKIGLKVPKLA